MISASCSVYQMAMLNSNTFCIWFAQLRLLAVEVIWSNHKKCCNATELTFQKILGVTFYSAHGVMLGAAMGDCSSKGHHRLLFFCGRTRTLFPNIL
jgi:hypothetical protein